MSLSTMPHPILYEFDKSISDLSKEFNTYVRKTRHPSIEAVVTKFARAMDHYVLYGKRELRDDYDKAVLTFAKIPFIERVKLREDFVAMMKLMEKTTNIIGNNFPTLYHPPANVFKKMEDLVQLFRNNNYVTGYGYGNVEPEGKLKSQCRTFIENKQKFLRRVQEKLNESRDTLARTAAIETRLMNDLRNILASELPGHKLYIFGSRVSGQALRDSDFDFYCDPTGHEYYRGLPIEKQKKHVELVANLLKRYSNLFKEVIPVSEATVPIVRLVHKPTDMDCDIGFKDGTGVENTKVLKVYLDLDPRVRWIVTAVKLWAHDNDILNNRYFRSHGLSWFVLFYLMKVGIIPPFKDLQKNCDPKLINGWNISFADPKSWWRPRNHSSKEELFKNFFYWVATTDLTDLCLCPYTGEDIDKGSIRGMPWLKDSDKLDRNGTTGLCILDVIEHNQNIVIGIRGRVYQDVQALCEEACKVLNGD